MKSLNQAFQEGDFSVPEGYARGRYIGLNGCFCFRKRTSHNNHFSGNPTKYLRWVLTTKRHQYEGLGWAAALRPGPWEGYVKAGSLKVVTTERTELIFLPRIHSDKSHHSRRVTLKTTEPSQKVCSMCCQLVQKMMGWGQIYFPICLPTDFFFILFSKFCWLSRILEQRQEVGPEPLCIALTPQRSYKSVEKNQ